MTPQEQAAFAQGFVEKCAQYGVNPELMFKEAAKGEQLAKLLNSTVGKADESLASTAVSFLADVPKKL